MYKERLNTLIRAYSSAKRNNEYYSKLENDKKELYLKVYKIRNLAENCKVLDLQIANIEKYWREGILSSLENEISKWLNVIYPADGYEIKLDLKVLRGKIHLRATVKSFNISESNLSIKGSQGRLFQQVVSFAAIVAIMSLKGIKTIYIDEAFSGASSKNMEIAGNIIKEVAKEGTNLIVIAQNSSIIQTTDCMQYVVSRSVDNKTTIQMIGENYGK